MRVSLAGSGRRQSRVGRRSLTSRAPLPGGRLADAHAHDATTPTTAHAHQNLDDARDTFRLLKTPVKRTLRFYIATDRKNDVKMYFFVRHARRRGYEHRQIVKVVTSEAESRAEDTSVIAERAPARGARARRYLVKYFVRVMSRFRARGRPIDTKPHRNSISALCITSLFGRLISCLVELLRRHEIFHRLDSSIRSFCFAGRAVRPVVRRTLTGRIFLFYHKKIFRAPYPKGAIEILLSNHAVRPLKG
ncbi:hypothetical protein EVAR_55227_1 [Eumeta japonica]|uniref:Uncharacterized protein n=1 Tax=Eumeta variegata TaxID=151549 RepID=A0A4C1ZSA5_EUMVA|nr:hypothetical protein EVAR_55227_1 [Eumeta japonica]